MPVLEPCNRLRLGHDAQPGLQCRSYFAVSGRRSRRRILSKCALIVDDSRTSRAVLQRILETHELMVDTAESAESALDYLTDNRPDVIFMDHLMPGMDGFEAVSAIKQNPDTATIPIMMYTSQKGDVYVGQARALGAVGVLPKEVEPVEVSKILESLRIVGNQPPRPDTIAAVEEDVSSDEYPILENLDQDMRLMLEDLFDQQRAILKRDLLKSSDTIAAKVADQIKASEDAEPGIDFEDKQWRIPPIAMIGITALVGIVAILSILYGQLNARLQNVIGDNADLVDSLNRQEAQRAGTEESLLRQLDEYRQSIDATQRSTLDAIEWGINRAGQFPFGEEPLGDTRVADFEELIAHLQAINFVGQVVVETHVGDHCLVLEPDGYQLANPQITASQCDARGFGFDEGLEMSRRQSVAMANLINSTGIRTAGGISFVVVPRGSTQPILQYPVNALTVTAKDWNDIADTNNRIGIEILPDPVTQ